jgi:hypothetical protein
MDNQLNDIIYSLHILDQPTAARRRRPGEEDWSVINPPPVIQLLAECPSLTQSDINKYLRCSYHLLACSILDESRSHDAYAPHEGLPQQQLLTGELVRTPTFEKDKDGKETCYFSFPKLSYKGPGWFRLRFSLVRVDPNRARETKHFPSLAEVQSDVFTVIRDDCHSRFKL